MKTTEHVTRANIVPWFFGVLLSAAGMFLGYQFGSDTARLLGGEPGLWARIGKGLVWGGVLAALQWPAVRAVGVHPLRFCLASGVGFAIGYPLGQTIQAIALQNWGLSWEWGYGSALVVFGLSLGVMQWWIFRGRLLRAGLWVLISVVGWVLTGVAWIGFRLGDGLDALVYGIAAGPGLVWLVRSQRRDAQSGVKSCS